MDLTTARDYANLLLGRCSREVISDYRYAITILYERVRHNRHTGEDIDEAESAYERLLLEKDDIMRMLELRKTDAHEVPSMAIFARIIEHAEKYRAMFNDLRD